jgi:Transposase DDE domain
VPFSPKDAHAFKFQNTFAPFAQGDGLPLAGILPAEDVEHLAAEQNVDFGSAAWAFWTPAVTLWTFLWQMLDADGSCRQAVAQTVLAFSLSGQPSELDTGAYCRARAKLPAALLQKLTYQVAQQLEDAALPAWRWRGRRAYAVDGTTSQLPDTAANQKAFPQAKTQKSGLGFPVIRWVVLLSLATAAVHGLAYGPYQGKQTGETALFRELLHCVAAGDIIVADRYYCSYFLVALLRARGVDVVFRLHQRRRYDFDRGQRLGANDHVVVWHKPARPVWLDESDYEALPATLVVREMRYHIPPQAGYRVTELVLATTLLDADVYPVEEVAELYHQRWHAELDIRTLKVTLGMDRLRCQTPFMIAKEIWAHCLAYNLVRKVAAQAAALADLSPRSLSFKAAKQAVLASWQKLTTATDGDYLDAASALLRVLRKQRVGHRPGRWEPRVVKRRPKPHKLMNEPRVQAKQRRAHLTEPLDKR